MRILLLVAAFSAAILAQRSMFFGQNRVTAPALDIVQSAKAGSTGTSATLVFGATPTNGNLIALAVCGDPAGLTGTPSGFSQIYDSGTVGGSTRGWLYTKTASSEGNSYQFTDSGSHISIVGFEVSGQTGSDGVSDDPQGSSNSLTPTRTPSVIPTQALAFSCRLSGSPTSVSGGWTMDQNYSGVFYVTAGASRDDLTTDTSTAISNTFSFATSTTGVGFIFLVK